MVEHYQALLAVKNARIAELDAVLTVACEELEGFYDNGDMTKSDLERLGTVIDGIAHVLEPDPS